MIPWWGLAILVLGANFALWGSVGLCRQSGIVIRRLRERWSARRKSPAASTVAGQVAGSVAGQVTGSADGQLTGPVGGQSTGQAVAVSGGAHPPARPEQLTVNDVAVLIPAHNEAVVLGDSLKAIMALVPARNVHVVSDGSTDDTVQIARRAGAKVISTKTNLGKAGALDEAITRFNLIRRFRVVMLLDADTRVQPGYFTAGLPMFDNPGVVAVAGCVKTAPGRALTFTGNVLVGHRQRIYAIGQRVVKFGQTWLRTNATHIVPGFASMYRSSVLPHIDMNPPGLVIEDFNMTFEVYQKRLGKVGFSLAAVAVTQDPDTIGDYVRQTKRWAIGMWQTVRRHPPRANLFTAMLALLLLELVTSSLLLLLLPLLLIVLVIPDLAGSALSWPVFSEVHAVVASHMTLPAAFFGILVPDLILTCVVAVVERQPRLLLFGLFFPLLRLLDAAIGLYAVPVAWLSASSGRWKSPARRAVPPASASGQPARRPLRPGGQRAGQVTAKASGQDVPAISGGRERGRSPAFAGERPHASA
jgi:cellulose synthase/poly-beta-1,6-N-acetylglucosamine synthase-like glycosyltransferase